MSTTCMSLYLLAHMKLTRESFIHIQNECLCRSERFLGCMHNYSAGQSVLGGFRVLMKEPVSLGSSAVLSVTATSGGGSSKIGGMGILQPGTQPGSEYSYGQGLACDLRSDFQSQRVLPWAVGEDSHDMLNEYRASLRLDATNPQENLYPDMYFALGNPDAFGPAPALVQEEVNRPKGAIPRPFYRYGVNRQE